jgi:hypothetical protein
MWLHLPAQVWLQASLSRSSPKEYFLTKTQGYDKSKMPMNETGKQIQSTIG